MNNMAKKKIQMLMDRGGKILCLEEEKVEIEVGEALATVDAYGKVTWIDRPKGTVNGNSKN